MQDCGLDSSEDTKVSCKRHNVKVNHLEDKIEELVNFFMSYHNSNVSKSLFFFVKTIEYKLGVSEL